MIYVVDDITIVEICGGLHSGARYTPDCRSYSMQAVLAVNLISPITVTVVPEHSSSTQGSDQAMSMSAIPCVPRVSLRILDTIADQPSGDHYFGPHHQHESLTYRYNRFISTIARTEVRTSRLLGVREHVVDNEMEVMQELLAAYRLLEAARKNTGYFVDCPPSQRLCPISQDVSQWPLSASMVALSKIRRTMDYVALQLFETKNDCSGIKTMPERF